MNLIFTDASPTAQELVSLLEKTDFEEIFHQADLLRRKTKGNDILIRGLLEFSSFCSRSCRYCGLNCSNRKLTRFRLEPSQIVETALEAAEAGYRTIVLQSGEDRWYTPQVIGDMVKSIRKSGAAITLSCGEYPREVYEYWHSCGADRYLLKHETADPLLYAALHPDSTLEARVQCLRDIKAVGMETGGGFMIGLPGQTLATIAADLLLLREIGCDMAGIGPFIPHPDTPLRDASPGDTELTKRAVALARLLLPNANLPATTALGVLDMTQKRSVFDCGANVIMQKVTPNQVKRLYEIYPSHLTDVSIRDGRRAVEEEILRLGRVPV